MKLAKGTPEPPVLTGWQAIAKFLGQPVSVAQRWAKEGMPVQRKGRNVTAVAEELGQWLGREAGTGETAHIAQRGESDLQKDLRRGLPSSAGTAKKPG